MACCRGVIGALILMVLFLPMVMAAGDIITQPQGSPIIVGASGQTNAGTTGPTSYSLTQTDIDYAEKKILEDMKAYNDENFQAFDGRINTFVTNQTMKLVLGCLGINLLVAGIVYYLIMKQTRDLSYQSISLKRKKDVDDRAYVAESLNGIRSKMESIEHEMKNKFDPAILNTRQLNDYRQQGGVIYEQRSEYPGRQPEYQPAPLANSDNAYRESQQQQAQGQYPQWEQYEQRPVDGQQREYEGTERQEDQSYL